MYNYAKEKQPIHFLQKDPEAIQRMYDFCFPIISHYVLEHGGQLPDAEDLFQDALIILWKTNPDKIKKSPTAYLYGICRRLWLHAMYRKRVPVESLESVVLADVQDVEADLCYRERRRLIWQKLAELDPGYRDVLMLFFEGYSMQRIAREMGYASAGYAKKKKCLGQKKLLTIIIADPRFGELKS